MTDEEVLWHMRENTPLNQFRTRLSDIIAEEEQADQQRSPRTPMERRKAEFRHAETLLNFRSPDKKRAGRWCDRPQV